MNAVLTTHTRRSKDRTIPICSGITLVEVLASLFIMAVLIGILVPVIVGAKKRAAETSDISELHQLGLAGAMYNEQFGEFPTGTPALVQAGMVPPNICSGMVDPYPKGLANYYLATVETNFHNGYTLAAPYRNSYIGAREFNLSMPILQDRLHGALNVGWLIDWSPAMLPLSPSGATPTGRYRRVVNDASVVIRNMIGEPIINQGRPGTRIVVADYFGDPQK